jgi:hypothetical protein
VRTFTCACGGRVFFENYLCLRCGRQLGFVPAAHLLSAIESRDGAWLALATGELVRKCANNVEHGICNWTVPAGDDETLCQACRLNHVIPDLSNAENVALWSEMERAKRRLIYALNKLGLPILSKRDSPERGLAFDIKAEIGSTTVLTGHADGLITLKLDEADDVVREKVRIAMHERYRTVLGHFRHEIGHYYWNVLIERGPLLEEFRALFGDEREDYGEALKRHYANDAPYDSERYISAYASAHPWEDWAETWAHYLLVDDTFETATSLGFAPQAASATLDGFDGWMARWIELAIALNELNRSLGLPDAYPFELSTTVQAKLRFVDAAIGGAAGSATLEGKGSA